MQGTIIFGLIFAILIAIFAIQNASIVALNILMWEFEISLAVVVLGSIIFGALVIGIFSYFKQFQLKRRNKNLRLEIQSLKEERDKLKEEKRKLEMYNPKSNMEESSVKKEDSPEKTEDKKEKRGFFGFGKKDSKDKPKEKEQTTKTEDKNEKSEQEDQDIAYNLQEDDSEETEES